MCKYCENVCFKGLEASGKPYVEYIHHPDTGSFLNFYRNEWTLCDKGGEHVTAVDYCPWCGRDLYNNSDIVCGEIKEECHSYAFQITTFDADIHNIEITDLFYSNYKSIEECKKGIESVIDDYEAGDCAHVFKLVPITSYKLVKRWEER